MDFTVQSRNVAYKISAKVIKKIHGQTQTKRGGGRTLPFPEYATV